MLVRIVLGISARRNPDMEDYKYIFVDKSGHCFDDFGHTDRGSDLVVHWFKQGRRFLVGDMLCFRDDLLTAGFKWGKDFYVRKVAKKA